MRRCHICGELLKERDLKLVAYLGFEVYQCKSLRICRWRRQRNFAKRQMAFGFKD